MSSGIPGLYLDVDFGLFSIGEMKGMEEVGIASVDIKLDVGRRRDLTGFECRRSIVSGG